MCLTGVSFIIFRVDEAQLKNAMAKNIARFRKQANLTQLELAEKLNYSDKAVSKWERGEAVPDTYVLKRMADIFRLHVDDFFDQTDTKKIYIGFSIEKRIIISVIICLSIFLAATIAFAFFIMYDAPISKPWMCFVCAVPASALSFLIFSATWKKPLVMAVSGSVFAWTLALSLFLAVALPKKFIFFAIGVPVQVIIILFYVLGIINKKRKKKQLNQ